ncbi:MAG: glycosyltransferase [Solirubrobacteraceae bacterium]
MAKICALNNYPLRKMWELSEHGAVPRQHAWGVDGLVADGHGVDFAPFHEPDERDALDGLSARLRGLAGHLDQEIYAARRMRTADTLYCADQTGLAGLALVRDLLPRSRLVSVVHHPIASPARLAAAARHDVLVCLSDAVCTELGRRLPRRRCRLVHLPWGPDLGCPLYHPRGEDNGVVSAGKSNRDLVTIAAALKRTGAAAVVYDLERQLATAPADPVRLVHPGGDGADPDSPGGFLAGHVIAEIAAAAVVVVPVRDPQRLTGLTEVVDALALAKPVIATRSPYFPFDIEAVGCGVWVEPGDVDGWARAIAHLLADGEARREMGAAGRRFAEAGWNYSAFCAGLSELMRT